MTELQPREFEDNYAECCGQRRAFSSADTTLPCGNGFCRNIVQKEDLSYGPRVCRGIQQLRQWLQGGEDVVMFRNGQLDSSNCGARSLTVVGPTRTYKTVAELEGQHLYDAPSQRQYAQHYTRGSKLDQGTDPNAGTTDQRQHAAESAGSGA